MTLLVRMSEEEYDAYRLGTLSALLLQWLEEAESKEPYAPTALCAKIAGRTAGEYMRLALDLDERLP